MKLPIYQVDAFASRLFSGNPAAVVVMDDWLPDAVLQAIAAENNLSETAFVIPRGQRCPLRWFTPTFEIDLCGHATLATAHVLFARRFPEMDALHFETLSGILTVRRENGLLFMDFPARPGDAVPVTPELVAALGRRPRELRRSRDLMAVFDTEAEVRNFVPDQARIAGLDAMALIVTAPGSDADFVSRFFAPKAGVAEDPVTGSSHCTLIPYWAARLGRDRLSARQLSARGGELHCELRAGRVVIGGRAVDYLQGEIDVP
ncbi:MAG TPA: PhzF family phenazine biosynthesis protein [Gammaproteobacteria bacterium]|jgi:predicted PhzF superfamily epimerase YddE/YHI9